MDCFIETGQFTPDQLCILGCYRKFFSVHSLGEILHCDGRSVRRTYLQYRRGTSSRTYPFEKPRRLDLQLWITALKLVTSPSLFVSPPLGEFLITPPNHDGWFMDEKKNVLYWLHEDDSYEMYTLDHGTRSHRRSRYRWSCTLSEQPQYTHLASISHQHDDLVYLHSTSAIPRLPTIRNKFLDILHSWPNQSLWQYLNCDGDGEWIRQGVLRQTLTIVHDGSYMKKVAPKL